MKRLFIFALIAALPAAALSLKDWEAKPDAAQIEYLTGCLARLVVAVNRTDKPLAEKIRRYYTDKPAGQKSSTGMLDLLQRIGQTESGGADLAKIDIEDIILANTAAKIGRMSVTAGAIAPPEKRDFRDLDPPHPGIPATVHETMPTDDPIGTGGFIGPPIYQIRDHTPDWIGRTMTVEGTVDKISSFAEIASIIFREAPDGFFKVFLPDAGPLRARYGADLSGLIGKTVRVTGDVKSYAGTKGGIRIYDLDKLKLVP